MILWVSLLTNPYKTIIYSLAKRHLRGTVRRPYLLNVPNTAYCSPPYGGEGEGGASSIFLF